MHVLYQAIGRLESIFKYMYIDLCRKNIKNNAYYYPIFYLSFI